MKRSFCYLLLTRDIGRQISDDGWEVIEPLHIASWQTIERRLSSDYMSLQGSVFHLKADFSQAIDDLTHRLHLMRRIFHAKDATAMEEFRNDELVLRLIFEEEGGVGNRFSVSKDMAEYLVFELFLTLNIAAPGSCNLSHGILRSHPEQFNIFGRTIDTDISLYGRSFEASLYEMEEHGWIAIEGLSVEAVADWISGVCPRFTMRPNNPAAKALFALQHLARSEQGPTSIIWIFYGLESLFQCKPGENFRTLVHRISLFLDLDAGAQSSLRKRLRELYDLRSAFVHGGHRVAHPLYNGLSDPDAEDNAYRYVRDSDFGAAVLIASIQRLVKLDWAYPIFEEVMSGHSVSSKT